MPHRPTTLILGAGASHSYGFPVGAGLRRAIISRGHAENAGDLLMTSRMTVRHFADQFHISGEPSIDAFLGRRFAEFEGIGKGMIASELLRCEASSNPFQDENSDHWYQYLRDVLTDGVTWDEFDPSWLSIVTFNYDRSLEYYLRRSLSATYGKQEAEVVERLGRLEIVHVYGWLGPLGDWPQAVPFGRISSASMPHVIRQATSSIVVIPEGRANSPSLIRSRELLAQAEVICMLGFGFDKVNVERLGAPFTFCMEDGHPKRAAATAYGLTAAESERAANRVFARPHPRMIGQPCLSMLRETLILD